ncbi:signal peptidase I [Streptomyces albus]|uniref:signal peptidase I n=1 Tax=Streptomyces sp. NRRL F-5639 TaxID=1463867 RepID=UPI000567F69B
MSDPAGGYGTGGPADPYGDAGPYGGAGSYGDAGSHGEGEPRQGHAQPYDAETYGHQGPYGYATPATSPPWQAPSAYPDAPAAHPAEPSAPYQDVPPWQHQGAPFSGQDSPGAVPPGQGAHGEPPEPPPAAEARPGEASAPLRRPGQGRAERRRAAKRIKRRRRLSATKEIPVLIGTALLIALVLKTFLVQAFVIPSGSMEQTIRVGDRVLVDKLTPWFGAKPDRGDVVVFEDPGGWLDNDTTGEKEKKDPPPGIKQGKEFLTFIGLLPSDDEQDLIKRVVAVGGDTVRCCDRQGRVTVNGTPLNEPYIHPGNDPSRTKFKVTVPQGRVFVMGDHRADSADSRYHLRDAEHGTIGEDRIVGRAVVIAWPIDHWRRLEEPATYASVPDAPGAAAPPPEGRDNRVAQLPLSAELPLVMGVVGLYRLRGRRMRSVRSGCGGLGGRRTVRFRVPGERTSWCGRQGGRRRTTGRGKRE